MKYLTDPIKSIFALLTGATVICLQDFEGETYKTTMRKDASGQNVAHVYWFPWTGHVICHADGTCTGRSSYIKRWKKL
jgi:hypothetical protein